MINFKVKAAALITVLVLFSAFYSMKPKSDIKSPSEMAERIAEQRSVLQRSFDLAQKLYISGRYSPCLLELAKIREVTSTFRNSEELKSFCEQGQALFLREQDLRMQEEKKIEEERQIGVYVENCRPQMADTPSEASIRQCLAPAIELNPENRYVLEMIYSAREIEEERRASIERRRADRVMALKGMAHFQHCRELHHLDRLSLAKTECENFVSKPYPKSAENKAMARREIASIESDLSREIREFTSSCQAFFAKGQFREAHLACARVLSEVPSDSVAKSLDRNILSKLRRRLKSIYEDSVLEESLGNVESAKVKWERILREDLVNGEYVKRAREKLERYGVG